jgi:hypothetical protein
VGGGGFVRGAIALGLLEGLEEPAHMAPPGTGASHIRGDDAESVAGVLTARAPSAPGQPGP